MDAREHGLLRGLARVALFDSRPRSRPPDPLRFWDTAAAAAAACDKSLRILPLHFADPPPSPGIAAASPTAGDEVLASSTHQCSILAPELHHTLPGTYFLVNVIRRRLDVSLSVSAKFPIILGRLARLGLGSPLSLANMFPNQGEVLLFGSPLELPRRMDRVSTAWPAIIWAIDFNRLQATVLKP